MLSKKMTKKIKIHGVAVTLEFGENHSHSDDSVGTATHTAPSAEMAEGSAGGPDDGEVFEMEGEKYRLGQHYCEEIDGHTTCSAAIYLASEEAGDRLFDGLSADEKDIITASPNGERSAQLGLAATEAANASHSGLASSASTLCGEQIQIDRSGQGSA